MTGKIIAVKSKKGGGEKATTIVVNGPSGVGKGTLINKVRSTQFCDSDDELIMMLTSLVVS